MVSWQGFKDFLTGTDPEEFRPYDPNATSIQGAYGVVPHAQGQLAGAQGRGPAQAGQVERYGGAQIATGPQDQFRQGQLGLMDLLAGASRGEGPSASGMAADRARESQLQQTMALQAGRRGAGAASGARMAQRGVALGNQSIMGQEQVGRAQEMAQARGMLGGLMAGARGQDLGLATSQAGMTQQARLASMDAANRRGEFNAGLQADQMRANDAYSLGLMGQLGGMSMAELQARMQQEQLAAGQLSQGTPGLLGSLVGAAGQLGGAYLMSDVNSKSGARKWTKAERQQHLGEQIISGLAAIPAGYLAGKAKRKEKAEAEAKEAEQKRQEEERFYRSYEMTFGRKHPDDPTLAGARALDNAAAELEYKAAERDRGREEMLDSARTEPSYDPSGYSFGAFADGGVVTRPTVALIGEEGPEAVVPLNDRRKARTMLDALTPYTYEYKDDAREAGMPPGRQAGVMHQDLMRSEMGRTMDAGKDPGTGYRQVDYVKGLPAMMAGLADINERLNRIERKKGRR